METDVMYVVENGEQNEGGSVVGIYSTHELAVDAAMRVGRHFEGGWAPSDVDSWVNGCDYVCIKEVRVDEAPEPRPFQSERYAEWGEPWPWAQ